METKGNKATTTAQGAEGQSEETTNETPVVVEETTVEVTNEEVTPAWASDLIESNKAVAESNNRLADALENFSGITPVGEQKKVVKHVPAYNATAVYVVAKGKQFNDVEDHKISYKAGDDVSHLGEKRITVMLENGLVVEK